MYISQFSYIEVYCGLYFIVKILRTISFVLYNVFVITNTPNPVSYPNIRTSSFCPLRGLKLFMNSEPTFKQFSGLNPIWMKTNFDPLFNKSLMRYINRHFWQSHSLLVLFVCSFPGVFRSNLTYLWCGFCVFVYSGHI